jgi:hypothetical protein
VTAAPVYQPICCEEHDGACSEPERDRVGPAEAQRFVGELEGECTDEDTRAEAHDQAPSASRWRDGQSNDRAEQERGAGDEPPESGLEHVRSISFRLDDGAATCDHGAVFSR